MMKKLRDEYKLFLKNESQRLSVQRQSLKKLETQEAQNQEAEILNAKAYEYDYEKCRLIKFISI